jgi:hypothetical protein
MGIVQARAGIFDAMPRRIHAVVQHRQSTDPPLTPEQRVIAVDLLWKVIDKKSYEKVVKKFEELLLDPESAQKTRKERQRRQAETGVSIAEAYAAFLREIDGVDLSPQEVCVQFVKKVFYLRPSEIERVLLVSNASQILIRINEKIATQQNNSKKHRKGRGV